MSSPSTTEPVIRAQYRCSLGLSSPKSCSKDFCGAPDCATPLVSSGNADPPQDGFGTMPRCPGSADGAGPCSDAETVDDVADVSLARHQSVNALHISRHLGLLAKRVAKGVDGGGVSPLRIADYPFAIPAFEEDSRDHPPS